jgi:hypothetical protein
MKYDSGVGQRKNMAMGNGSEPGETFGCKPHDHCNGPVMAPASEMSAGARADGPKRGADKPVGMGRGKYPAQSSPDHGPHGKIGEMP